MAMPRRKRLTLANDLPEGGPPAFEHVQMQLVQKGIVGRREEAAFEHVQLQRREPRVEVADIPKDPCASMRYSKMT